MAMANVANEINSVKYSDFPTLIGKVRELAEQYGDLPMNSLINAFGTIGIGGLAGMGTQNPYVQNRRVKGISTPPCVYNKTEISDFLKAPGQNEKALRQAEKSLEVSSYPLFHARTLYQNMLTYRSYIAPAFADEEQTKTQDFTREWKLLEKLRVAFETKEKAHEIAGQALQEGKVFYYPRYSVDKPHNKVNHAFMQQLPSDWIKIVGFNNKSKYTLAFNMMYFTEPGTDFRQFGELFYPYISDFNTVVWPKPKGAGTKLIYARESRIDVGMVKKIGVNADVYYQNGRWFYWVTLPIDEVFTFEIDDTNRNVISPFTGLFLDLIQLVAYENIQLEIIQNPLVSLLTGEIPYYDDPGANNVDKYKLSNAGRTLFEALFYQTLVKNNTGGIGFFAAPLNNMQLHTLSEAPSAMEISSNGYGYTLSKAGLSGIVPVNGDSRAEMVKVSLMLESQFAKTIYSCFKRMYKCIIEKLNLKYDWKLEMFGTLSREKEEIEEARNGMTLGILPATLRYMALHDMTLFDDLSVSDAIISSKLLDRRIPLQSTYHSQAVSSGQTNVGSRTQGSGVTVEETTTTEINKGGRPRSEDISSEGQEADEDDGK